MMLNNVKVVIEICNVNSLERSYILQDANCSFQEKT